MKVKVSTKTGKIIGEAPLDLNLDENTGITRLSNGTIALVYKVGNTAFGEVITRKKAVELALKFKKLELLTKLKILGEPIPSASPTDILIDLLNYYKY